LGFFKKITDLALLWASNFATQSPIVIVVILPKHRHDLNPCKNDIICPSSNGNHPKKARLRTIFLSAVKNVYRVVKDSTTRSA